MTEKRDKLLFIDSDSSSQEEQDISNGRNIEKGKEYVIKGSAKLGQNKMGRNFFKMQENNEDEYFHQQKIPQTKDTGTKRNKEKKTVMDQVVVSRYGIEQECHQNSETNSSSEQKPKSNDQEKGIPSKVQQPKRKKQKLLTFHFDDSDDEIPSDQQSNNNSQNQSRQISASQLFKQNNPENQQQDNNEEVQPVQNKNQEEVSNKKPITALDIEAKIDKYEFALSSIPKGSVLETQVFKSNPASIFFYPKYDVVLNGTDLHIISGKKLMGNMGSNYPLSINPQNFSHLIPRNYIGKLRSTNQQNLYNIFSEGSNPENMRGNFQGKKRRSVMASIQIKMAKNTPRQLHVYILKAGVKYLDLLEYPHQEPDLKQLYQKKENCSAIDYYCSKKPRWCENVKQYILNFGGVIREASIRNFILHNPKTEQQILLFGKVENNLYRMNVCHPLNPQMALGISLCMFDNEI